MSQEGRGDGGFGWVMPAIVLLLFAFAAVLLATNILPARRNLSKMKAEKERLEVDLRRLTEIERNLALRARALQQDPMTQETEFRRTYRTGRPGETMYQFEEDTPATGTGPSAPPR